MNHYVKIGLITQKQVEILLLGYEKTGSSKKNAKLQSNKLINDGFKLLGLFISPRAYYFCIYSKVIKDITILF